ncbi:hypothetical protein PN36_33715 [Candidatus Thiomargarita nelsonii]|uniref:Uncharacterized protein n=1 Tax=Candidatus Thiomargarita nelsonii TaxID=1003181 RepID=A0A0A6RMB0_9GAMM|nr:hypothetical protein PN36_33715 [Candidatus Thiomargarita nelsonii]
MNEDTLKEITKRVAEYKDRLDDSVESKESLEAHIEALSDVFHVSRKEVESIANGVIQSRNEGRDLKSRIASGVYSKGVILSMVVVLSVVLVLIGRNLPLESRSESLPSEAPLVESNSVTPNYNVFFKKSVFAQVLASMSAIKPLVMEYYSMTGKYPSTFEEIGLKRTDMSSGKYIDDMVIGKKGELIVKPSQELGDGVIIALVPKETMGGMSMEWDCETSYSDSILFPCNKISSDKYLSLF